MRSPLQRQLIVLSVGALAALVSCGDVHDPLVVKPEQSTSTTAKGVSVQATQKPVAVLDAVRFRRATNVKRVRDAAWVIAVAKSEAERTARVVAERRVTAAPPVATTGSLAQVMQCIKDHESGDYSESSHTGDGSGAYQMIPGTWRALSSMAGYPGYSYAYQAPPAVQDAVVLWALTHGHAGNWSPRYGNDPCTVGMGG